MISFRPFSLLILSFAALARAQTSTPAAPAPGDSSAEKILNLDSFVVTAGLDRKTAFELAQGTSILAGDELRRRAAATLGATLAATPGLSGTAFGPSASRPIIRGLGGERVRMLENGVGSLDASNVSPDHNVSVEPLLVERIEVLRGPAALLYGSSAVGGVVNIIDNRIPSAAPNAPFGGLAEFRYESAANERTGVFATGAGSNRFAMQVNGARTTTDDVAIPDYADPEHPSDRGTLPNSARSTSSASLGATAFGAAGTFGVAVSAYDTLYGVPVGEPIAIDLEQRRFDLRGELTRPFAFFKSAKLRVGVADYTHSEVDLDSGDINTTFKNQAYEGRLELIQQESGNLTGTVGYQIARSDFSAVGAEVVTPPSITQSHALFAVESFKVNPALNLQFGARYEFQSIRLGEVDEDLPAYPGYAARTGQKNTDHGLSVSAGAVYYPAKDYSLGLSLAYSQRLPAAVELFSNGPHGGTGSYEIGTTGLDHENSLGLDLTLRKRAGFVTGSAGVFVHQIDNFIFEQRDERRYFDDATGDLLNYPVPDGDEYLPVYQFVARDALFYGAEAEVQFHLIDGPGQRLHLSLLGDLVRAEQTTDDQALPRIPPARLGLGLGYEHGRWSLGTEVRHSFKQTRFAAEETETDAYTLVGIHALYRFADRGPGHPGLEVFARGDNLTDADARLATSFLKAIAPLPGRSFTIGARLSF